MKHTFFVDFGQKQILAPYANETTGNAVRLYNRVLFLQRNLMTGLAKEPVLRHPLEQEAIDTVSEGIRLHNTRTNVKPYAEPTADHWFLSAYVWMSILQETGDKDYYSLPGQVNQRVVSRVCQAFKSFFAAMKAYKQNPSAFTGRPELPRYQKQKHMTVSFSSQTCTIKKDWTGRQFLCFPKTDAKLCLGHLNLKGKLQSVELVPCGNGFRCHITTEDGLAEAELSPKEERFYAADPGVDSFLTVAGNFEMRPFALDGKFLKSWNRLYNKKMAEMRSALTKGKQTQKNVPVPDTRAMKQTTRKRSRRFRDIFYKKAHFLCRMAVRDHVDHILFGWNRNIKQDSHPGATNNQNFVQLPYQQFLAILKRVAAKYGILVTEQEESYTSKASFLDGDAIPTYGVDDADTEFSGTRTTRSTYCSKDGTVINADVNGALNILRKYKWDAFDGMEGFECFLQPIRRYGFETFYPGKKGIARNVHSGSQVVPTGIQCAA